MKLSTPRRMICTMALCVAVACAGAAEPEQSTAGARFVRGQTDVILRVAKQYPCTAAAMMQALGMEPAAEGTLLLDQVPTPEVISRLIRALASTADLRGTLLSLRNPYSEQALLVHAEWMASLPAPDTIVLKFRTEWIARDGTALSPQHLVEPDATLRISGNRLFFTTSADAPPITAAVGGVVD
jgi:hypothetical protein